MTDLYAGGGGRCPGCGAWVDARFCTRCGTPLPTSPPTATGPTPGAPRTETPPSTGRRSTTRVALLGVLVFVLLIALGAGSVYGFYWWQDRPVNQALTEGSEATDTVLDALADASDLPGLSGAAAQASKGVVRIDKALAGIDEEEGDLADRARDVLEDQRSLLGAVAPLEALSEESLTVWGAAFPEVLDARASLSRSRIALSSVDRGAARVVTDPQRAVDHAVEVVGDVAGTTLTADLESFLDEMESIARTREAAALGERAALSAEAARAVVEGQSGRAGERLTGLSDALGALADLQGMDPESLDLWASAEPTLASATESLGLDATAALSSMDGWVEQAVQRMERWEAAYEAAQAERSGATSRLDAYAPGVRRVLRRYDRARDATADALERAELDDSSASWEVEGAMEEGVLTRQDLLNQLQEMSPPSGVGDAHRELVSVISEAVEAMITGEQAVEDWNACYWECADSFRDMEGWRSFSSSSAQITYRFDTARKGWDSALSAALAQANAVALPPMPPV